MIATRFAEHLGLAQEERNATYWFTLFMLPGCTAVSFELSRFFGDDIDFRAAAYDLEPSTVDGLRYVLSHAGSAEPSLLRRTALRARLLGGRMKPMIQSILAHCAINVRLAERLELGERTESALAHSFAEWSGKGIPAGVRGQDIAMPVRIGSLADVVEFVSRERGVDAAMQAARKFSGTRFDPELVDEWCRAGRSLLADIQESAAWDFVMSYDANRPLSENELAVALELVADYSDLKSPWFTGHSRGVADLTERAARGMGLPKAGVATARNAALLHDIGRAGVPNTIWDKPGTLDDDEWERMRIHAYYTDRVVRRSGSLAHLAPVASAAHENPNGTGYPRGIAGETIPLVGRVLACADRYHAMLEARPHRPALSRSEASRELRRMALDGEADGTAADAVLEAAGHAVRRRPSATAGLTPRELEILELAARGAATKRIAHRLGISPKTVGNHIESIYSKIGVSSRAEAAFFAMQNGLVSAP
jgi:HD-GYP domain-containing protein (c-di-GMP phosphodiesterase class II)